MVTTKVVTVVDEGTVVVTGTAMDDRVPAEAGKGNRRLVLVLSWFVDAYIPLFNIKRRGPSSSDYSPHNIAANIRLKEIRRNNKTVNNRRGRNSLNQRRSCGVPNLDVTRPKLSIALQRTQQNSQQNLSLTMSALEVPVSATRNRFKSSNSPSTPTT
ncbi:12197_t:CDS:2, partial [Acaulospora colombiana]